MNLLKISAIPPGAVSSSPATYNEAEANPYPNLPDPLLLEEWAEGDDRRRLAQPAPSANSSRTSSAKSTGARRRRPRSRGQS